MSAFKIAAIHFLFSSETVFVFGGTGSLYSSSLLYAGSLGWPCSSVVLFVVRLFFVGFFLAIYVVVEMIIFELVHETTEKLRLASSFCRIPLQDLLEPVLSYRHRVDHRIIFRLIYVWLACLRCWHVATWWLLFDAMYLRCD